MKDVQALLTRHGQAVVELSRLLIGLETNHRLEPVGVYADRLKVGRGTIQSAFRALEEAGAVQILRRGHLGSYVAWSDRQKLWSFTGYGVISGAMPLPYTRRYEGLATALYSVFGRFRVPFGMAYVRGSVNRVEGLRAGRFHFAVVAQLTAELLLRNNDDLAVVGILPAQTYVKEHAVILREGAGSRIRDGMKVGIDPASIDQVHLTELECEGKQVQFVELTYMSLLDRLCNGDIDAAVWSTEEIQSPRLAQALGRLRTYPFTHEEARRLARRNTQAAILVARPYFRLSGLLEQVLDIQSICDIQAQVLSGEMLPSY